MMSLHKLTAGDGYTYLTRSVAALDATEGFTSLADYYAAKGEAPGIWMGAGLDSLGVSGRVSEEQMLNLFGQGLHPDAQRIVEESLAAGLSPDDAYAASKLGRKFPVIEGDERWREGLRDAYQRYNTDRGNKAAAKILPEEKSRIRSELAHTLFVEMHRREPAEQELTAFVAQVSRPLSSAVAGFDATFSPVKSISTLWAVAPLEVAQQIEAAHLAAVTRTLEWMQTEAAYTRVGPAGVAQVDTKGLVMAAFTHRDSRAGDPDLHTHVAISNKVETLDGRWLALDARMLYRLNVAASEHYNTVLEAEYTARLGGRFEERSMGPGKRPVRELAGVDLGLNTRWSSRRAAMDAHRPSLVDKFVADHGRLPTVLEMIDVNQQANLDTRQAKHEPRSLAEQRQQWRAQALDYLGSPEALAQMLAAVNTPGQTRQISPQLLSELIADTMTVVSGARAQWRWSNVIAEAFRQVRYADIDPAAAVHVAHQVAEAVLSPEHSTAIGMTATLRSATPEPLLRADRTGQFTVAKGQLYTSAEILDAETRIVTAAGRGGGRALEPVDVQIGLLEWSANTGRTLNTGQETALLDIATSGVRVQLLTAAAGTGKSTLMSAVARVALANGMNIVGLSPEASGAQQLALELGGIDTDTVDKLVFDLREVDPGSWQPWMAGINADTLVIVDEAGLASTRNLDVLIRFVGDRGGRVLLVGDDQQRAAAGAGGVLRDIEVTHGASTLNEVMRFANELEGEASLALRAGDPSAAGFYHDRGRLHAVTPDTAVDQVYRAWAADTAAGLDSLMIAKQLDVVAQLNLRARTDRLAAVGGPVGTELTLANGETVSAGDIIVTKKNQRTLSLGGTDFVRNNYRWQVQEILDDGSILATRLGRNTSRVLPAWYLEKGEVRLGYAHTLASVQGLTADTAKLLGDAALTRNEFYPGMTRGRHGNDFYLQIGGQGDTHDVTKPEAISPQTMVETVEQIILTDGSARSATTEIREARDPRLQLGHAGNAYSHAVVTAAETMIGPKQVAQITADAEQAVPGVTSAAAWNTLRGHLVLLAAGGRDPAPLLAGAAAQRELGTARDVAAVLDYRMDPTGNHSQGAGPLPWLPATPPNLLTLAGWEQYLPEHAARVTGHADGVRAAALAWTAETAPTWAAPYLQNPQLTADLAIWRASQGVPESDLRPAGDRPAPLTLAKWHHTMTVRAVGEAGNPADGADRWAAILVRRGVNLSTDTFWPVLAARLTLADAAGLNVPALLDAAMVAGPVDGRPALPAETTASSLWWRLAQNRQLGSLATGPAAAGHHLRPAWTPRLSDAVGPDAADRIMTDRLWPVIVTHLDIAARDGLDVEHTITAAAQLLTGHGDTIGPHELAAMLLWQIGIVTDPRPATGPNLDEPAYPDPLDLETHAAADAHTLPDHIHTDGVAVDVVAAAPSEAEPELAADPFNPDAFAEAAAAFDREHPAAQTEPADAQPDDPEPRPVDQLPDWLPAAAPADPAVSTAVDPVEAAAASADDPDPDADLRSRLYAANAAAHQYYLQQARQVGAWVPRYVTDRGLDPADIGQATNRFDALYNHLRKEGFTDTELQTAGLVTVGRRGNLIDRFRDRAMLPYYTPTGDIAGFTGRINPDHNHHDPANPDAKYINGPGTPVFSKRELPFGLSPDVVQALRDGADIVLVEGPFDAHAVNTAAATAGRPLVAIAPNGTALTAAQLTALDDIAPLADRTIIEAFDTDPAGRSAAFKAHNTLAKVGVHNARTTTGLTGKDPAQMLADTTSAELLTALRQHQPLTDLVVDAIVARWPTNNGTVESRVLALKEAAPHIAAMTTAEQHRQAGRLADHIHIDPFRILDTIYTTDPIRTPAPNPTADLGPLGLPLPPQLTTPATTPEQQRQFQETVNRLLHPQPAAARPSATDRAAQAAQFDEQIRLIDARIQQKQAAELRGRDQVAEEAAQIDLGMEREIDD